MDDDGFGYFIFFDGGFGCIGFDVDSDNVVDVSGGGVLVFFVDYCGMMGIGVVSNFENGV